MIGPLLGFAVVSVQMRGSGCSGGAFDLFDLPTTYDGYDAVEAVAAQKWVKGGKVGMGGISFSGITQLFVAGTRPPHLAAISPMSVSDDLYTATGYPGGIFNSGFAKTWVQERMDDAKPAPAGGQPYARVLTKQGDKHCIANQKLRLQTQDALEIQKQNPFRTPSLFSQRAPGPWLKHAKVPVFLVGQFQDEQTGGHFAESIKNLNKNPNVWVTLQNGVHADSLGPSTITRWAEFMKLYVADEIPVIPQPVIDLSGALYQYLADAGAAPVEQSRFAGTTERRRRQGHLQEGSSDTAADGQRRRPAGRGLDRRSLGARLQRLAAEGRRGRRATTWGRTERSARSPPRRARRPTRRTRARARKQTLPGDGAEDAWKAQPPYQWAPIAAGKGLGFISQAAHHRRRDRRSLEPRPLPQVLGQGHRPAGDAQRGPGRRQRDLRAERLAPRLAPQAERPAVDRARPVPHAPEEGRREASQAAVRARAGADLSRGARVPRRARGSASRSRRWAAIGRAGPSPRWTRARTNNTIALGGARASSLVLPVVAGATAKGTPLPAPTALRGEPNRAYKTASNGG